MSALTRSTHLQHLQLLEALLHQLLYFALVALDAGLPESVSCPSLGILAEVVGGKLAALAHEGTEERSGLVGRGVCGHRRWNMRFRSEWSQKNYDPQFGMRGICLECWTVRWQLFEAVGVNVARINLKGGHDGWKSMWTERPWSIATSHPHLRARRVPCRFDKGITRIINYHLQQYSASSCRVAFEDALNAGFFSKKDLSAIPPLAAAHQAIIYALIPTKWLRYVITYPAPLSHLPPTVGCWLLWKLLVADGSVHQQSSHSERRAIVETHQICSQDDKH